jgi:hypothetical protein
MSFIGGTVASPSTQMTIDSTGNVGIGTSSPQRPLQVFYDSAVIGAYSMVLQGRVGGYGAGVSFQSVLTGGALAEMARITADGESSWNTTASTQDAGLRFYTALDGTVAEKMRIDASGQVGIGTSTPTAKLDVVGNAYVRSGVMYSDTFTAYSGTNLAINAGSGYMAFATAATERMRIDSSGNVAVGTTTPVSKLHVNSTGSTATFTTVGNGNGGVQLGVNSSGVSILTAYSATGILFGNNNASSFNEFARFDSSGNVMVGTTSSSAAFTVARGAGVAADISLRGGNNAAGAEFYVAQATDGLVAYLYNRANGPIVFATNNTERARIDSSGNLLVGTTGTGATQTGVKIIPALGGQVGYIDISHANGTASGNGYMAFFYNATNIGGVTQSGTAAVLFNTTSDSRLKKNVANADDAASLIDALQVRKFDWNADDSHQRYGFIAQELLEVAPEAVHQPPNPDDMMGVDYSKLVPMLVKELQSVRARLAILEGNQ